ncbi:MAG: rRNA maturation RNase YbeY [Proteobacteria bacterium]|jgi:probable rRNA maturation factor|nr:rRNA maturation RNase YbeY [Pseudomonadota bacterium]NBP13951.1 rRNA maturation RNase YbeY [bacterium]
MITIKNSQRTIEVDTQKLEQSAQTILKELGYEGYDLGIWLTTNKTIHSYNKTYRKKDKPTDILSFPYHQLEPGEKIKPLDDEDKNVGDLIISLEFVQGVLPLYDVTLQERLNTLLIHGICHLLGYSHYDEENDKIMSKLEKKLAKKLEA